MGLGFNNPLPSSMGSELKKCGKILASFVDPRQAFGADRVIPPEILANAKGLAILTVFKVGFLGSGRVGSGVVVARLGDGRWSAPSAIATGGAGFGGQIGFELTDFVFILNDKAAVRAFSQIGSITLGGNVSIAVGPVGRNAEAAGAASLKGVAGVFSYSKTKGLFAGVSLEGSALIERRDANEKMYGSRITAAQLLEGRVPAPSAAEPLMRVLNSRVFAGVPSSSRNEEMYNDIPVYDDRHDAVLWEGRRGSALNEGVRRDRTTSTSSADGDYEYRDRPKRASTWQDDIYDRQPSSASANRSPPSRVNPSETFDRLTTGTKGSGVSIPRRSTGGFDDDYVFSDKKPQRPTAPKPEFGKKKATPLAANQAIALFNFDAAQDGDLGFKKGDVITIVKRTESTNDWWTGRLAEKEGIFPA
ncbi:MAG: hypothetical protein M1829_006045 [Trizodia sp. TS-e1964]|nr:MAG: hypothetical protein M1829_006045 [Trizodia sp. TS-e1964]